MSTDPMIHLSEHIPPRIGDPIDPNAEVLGGAPGPSAGPGPSGAPGSSNAPGGLPPWDVEPAVEPEPSPRRRRALRIGPRSLTARLVTGVVTLVALLVLATGMGTYLALRPFLFGRLNQQVGAAASQNAVNISRCLLTATNNSIPTDCFNTSEREWIAVLDPTGQPVFEFNSNDPTGSVVPLTLSAAQQRAIAADPGAIHQVDVNGASLRVMGKTTSRPGFSGLIFVTGLSTEDVSRTLHRLVVLEWAIGGAAVLVAFAATFGGVQFSLRRLRRVTATAHEVAAELSPSGAGLDRRVPVDETSTEVGQLAVSMNTLLSAVETQFAARLESEQRMRQFLADASHELRTPLTSIRGYAELARMQRDFGDEGDPANLDRIESEGTRMSRLIDDLLMLARSDQSADAGVAPVRELIDVDALLDDVVSGARAAFPQREIRLSAPPGLTLVGDPDQLVRAVRNLVNNAAIHTRADGPIGVDARRQADTIVIQVADAGPGLPPAEAAHVFERFWRADKARTRARGGSGLGMSIVASIIQGHGGTVRFDSSVAAGSTVTIQLPAGAA